MTKAIDYSTFIESKIIETKKSGFNVPSEWLHESNKPHQSAIIPWLLEGGCRALFAGFGLGKTQIQLEVCRLVIKNYGGKALIILPLGVKQEFKNDAERLGLKIEYVRNNQEIDSAEESILITNYERVRDGGIDVNKFVVVSLDEASVLRGYGTKTYQEFLPMFKDVRFKFVCTATPSPNKFKELIHYAGFLGVMDTGQALTRFFKRDSTQANNLTLHPHKEKEFWLWVSSWALFINKPSDLGFSDEGYDLPEMTITYHRVSESEKKDIKDDRGQFKMFKDMAVSLSDAAKVKRESLHDRVSKAEEIIRADNPEKHWLLWHHLESEREAIEKALPFAKSVYGNQPDDAKEDLLIGFGKGEYSLLATKPEIAGSGCNFQKHCHSAIFLGINYEFNDFIQAIHRIHRFGQKNTVEIHIIYTDAEEVILKKLQEKWQNHYKLVENMTSIIKEFGLSNAEDIGQLKRTIGVDRVEVKGKFFNYINNDCVVETKARPDDSIDLICTSIPFSNQYEYTPSYNDFGHNNDDDNFFEQMDFLIPELHRTLKPGRIAAIHVKDRIMFGNVTGMAVPTVNPFSDKTVAAFTKHGFAFLARITITTDVVRENSQTYRLTWSEQCKDGTKMGAGMPEYLLIFRKLPTSLENAYADEPVTKTKDDYKKARWQIDAHGFWRSSGDRFLTPEEICSTDLKHVVQAFKDFSKSTVYNYEEHVSLGTQLEERDRLPGSFMLFAPESTNEFVWSDVTRMRTLNADQAKRNLEQHVCPLQFDIVDRVINRYSNEGDLVYDPFGGIGTVPFRAIALKRRGLACELNPMYFTHGVNYCKEAEYKRCVPTLFDFVDEEKPINEESSPEVKKPWYHKFSKSLSLGPTYNSEGDIE